MPAQKLPYQTSRTEPLFEPSSQSIVSIDIDKLAPHPLLKTLYDQDSSDNLASSLKSIGQISPLLVEQIDQRFQVLSGNRRLLAACELGWKSLQAIVCKPSDDHQRQWWILESNHQRSKTFSQKMREADLMEHLVKDESRTRSLANLSVGPKLRVFDGSECLNSDTPDLAEVEQLSELRSTPPPPDHQEKFPETFGHPNCQSDRPRRKRFVPSGKSGLESGSGGRCPRFVVCERTRWRLENGFCCL